MCINNTSILFGQINFRPEPSLYGLEWTNGKQGPCRLPVWTTELFYSAFLSHSFCFVSIWLLRPFPLNKYFPKQTNHTVPLIRTYRVHCRQGQDLQASAAPVPACLPQCVLAAAGHCGLSTLLLSDNDPGVHEASAVCRVPATSPAGCCPTFNREHSINDYKNFSRNCHM